MTEANDGPGLSISAITAVVQSWEHVKRIPNVGTVVGDLIFGKFFELAPHAIELYPFYCNSMDELFEDPLFRAHSSRVVETFDFIVTTLLMDVDRSFLVELGERHVGYPGVNPTFFKPLGAAVMHALETGMADIWNEDLREAWLQVITFLATSMTEGMESKIKKRNRRRKQRSKSEATIAKEPKTDDRSHMSETASLGNDTANETLGDESTEFFEPATPGGTDLDASSASASSSSSSSAPSRPPESPRPNKHHQESPRRKTRKPAAVCQQSPKSVVDAPTSPSNTTTVVEQHLMCVEDLRAIQTSWEFVVHQQKSSSGGAARNTFRTNLFGHFFALVEQPKQLQEEQEKHYESDDGCSSAPEQGLSPTKSPTKKKKKQLHWRHFIPSHHRGFLRRPSSFSNAMSHSEKQQQSLNNRSLERPQVLCQVLDKVELIVNDKRNNNANTKIHKTLLQDSDRDAIAELGKQHNAESSGNKDNEFPLQVDYLAHFVQAFLLALKEGAKVNVEEQQ